MSIIQNKLADNKDKKDNVINTSTQVGQEDKNKNQPTGPVPQGPMQGEKKTGQAGTGAPQNVPQQAGAQPNAVPQNGIDVAGVIAVADEQWAAREHPQTEIQGEHHPFIISGGDCIPLLEDDENSWEPELDNRKVQIHIPLETLKNMDGRKLADLWNGEISGKPYGFVPNREELVELREYHLRNKLEKNHMSYKDYG